MGWFIGFFGNIKNIIMALGALFLGGYVIKQKYNAYKAEDKLKNIETKIAKTNVVVAKEQAKAKAKAVELETSTHIETLKELNKQKEIVHEEMVEIEKNIEQHINNKKKVKVSFEI